MTGDTKAFLCCMICTAAMMALLDFFSCIRIKVIKSAATDFILDIVWWITAVAAVSFCLWESNSFSLRLYELVSVALGIILYKIIFSKALKWTFCLILSIIIRIFSTFFKIIKRILKILLTPALFLYKILVRGLLGNCKIKKFHNCR